VLKLELIKICLCPRRTLDYVFVNQDLRVVGASVLPHVDPESVLPTNRYAIDNSYSLDEALSHLSIAEIDANNHHDFAVTTTQPSLSWPSDHFMVLASIELESFATNS
jgi:hypothetical protein